MKVIILPFAGGNSYSFNFLKPYFNNKGIELIVMEYPGRGDRVSEKLKETIDEIVDDCFLKLSRILNEGDRYIIYGHSMGGLIGYLLCKRLELLKSIQEPVKLIVSGNKAPSIAKEEPIHYLPSEVFWRKISDLGGFPKEIIKEKLLRDFFEPILKSDFKVVEEYKYSNSTKLNIPIDVIYGSEEDIQQKVQDWKQETDKKVTFTELSGNHFFIYDHVEFFVHLFKNSFRYQSSLNR